MIEPREETDDMGEETVKRDGTPENEQMTKRLLEHSRECRRPQPLIADEPRQEESERERDARMNAAMPNPDYGGLTPEEFAARAERDAEAILAAPEFKPPPKVNPNQDDAEIVSRPSESTPQEGGN